MTNTTPVLHNLSSLLLISLTFTFLLSSNATVLNGIAIINPPYVIPGVNQNVSGGTIYQLFEEACRQLNITANYQTINISSPNMNTDLLKAMDLDQYDFVLGFPTFDNDARPARRQAVDYVSGFQMAEDSVTVFLPDLLPILVDRVLHETFFAGVIILVPWFFLSASLSYLVHYKRFSKTSFTTGFFQAFRLLLFRKQKISQISRIFILLFWIATAIVAMLMLGDFVYVVATMVINVQSTQTSSPFNDHTATCVVKNDYLVEDYLIMHPEIAAMRVLDIQTCFDHLGEAVVGSFIISSSKIHQFFYENPQANNQFKFVKKDFINIYYELFVKDNIDSKQAIFDVISGFEPDFVSTLTSNSTSPPTYNTIIKSTAFSDSIVVIFTSLTISCFFIILFLSNMIYKKATKRRAKKLTQAQEIAASEGTLRKRLGKIKLKIDIERAKTTVPVDRDPESARREQNEVYGSPFMLQDLQNDRLIKSGSSEIKDKNEEVDTASIFDSGIQPYKFHRGDAKRQQGPAMKNQDLSTKENNNIEICTE